MRWCIDYRRLNDCTVKDAYPFPKISMCLDCLSNASVFSVMDLQSGYWQLQTAPEDRHKTALSPNMVYLSILRCHLTYAMPLLRFKGVWS